jgi:hypothetical protein
MAASVSMNAKTLAFSSFFSSAVSNADTLPLAFECWIEVSSSAFDPSWISESCLRLCMRRRFLNLLQS